MLDDVNNLEGLTRLTRLARDRGQSGERWLARLFASQLEQLAETALDVAIETGDPVGKVLARAVTRRGTPTLVARLAELCDDEPYRHAVTLRELALVVTQRLVAQRRQIGWGDSEKETEEFALLLHKLSIRLRDVGQTEKAAEISEEVVEIFLSLDARWPLRHRLGLVGVFYTRAAFLGDLGQRERALEITRRAVAKARTITGDFPDAGQRELGGSLNNLGNALVKLGHAEEAIEPLTEAVEIQRRRHLRGEADASRELAGSLHNLGMELYSLGCQRKAVEALGEAVALRRRLAAAQPKAFEAELATSLDHLAQILLELGETRDAREHAEAAVACYRKLAARRPEVFEPLLAMSLTNLGNLASRSGDSDLALRLLDQAASRYRRLTAQRQDVDRADLGRCLLDQAAAFIDLELWPQAERAALGAVEVFRQPATDGSPRATERELASSFANLAAARIGLEHWEPAVHAARQAVAVFHRLSRRQSSAATAGLVSSLINLALGRRGLGRREAALAAGEAAVRICRRSKDDPGFLERRAHSLDLLGLLLDDLDRHSEAIRASRTAVGLRRRAVARDEAQGTQPALASTLVNHAHRLRNGARHQEAFVVAEEALGIYERLADAGRTIDEAELARSRDILDAVAHDLGLATD